MEECLALTERAQPRLKFSHTMSTLFPVARWSGHDVGIVPQSRSRRVMEATPDRCPLGVDPAALENLRTQLTGTLMLREDSGYAAACAQGNGHFRDILPVVFAGKHGSSGPSDPRLQKASGSIFERQQLPQSMRLVLNAEKDLVRFTLNCAKSDTFRFTLNPPSAAVGLLLIHTGQRRISP
jgi:hypothetical protein